MHSVRVLCTISLALFSLSACQALLGPPEPDDPQPSGPRFLAEDYRVNAANYFDSQRYDRARQQWEQSLEIEGENWSARLGIAACDLYEGRIMFAKGNLRDARALLRRSEMRVRQLWDGTIGTDALESIETTQQPWRAALTLAEVQRSQSEVDEGEMRGLEAQVQTLNLGDRRRQPMLDRIIDLQTRSTRKRIAARQLFAQLAAMENAAPNAILSYAELLDLSGEVDAAEVQFERYASIADEALERLRDGLDRVSENYTTEQTQRLARAAFESKIASNVDKQVAVLDRLGRMHFQSSAAAGIDPETRAAHLGSAIEHLNRAVRLDPNRMALYIKLAQCEGALGLYDSALDHLDYYLREAARQNTEFGPETKEAFRLKSELEALRGTGGRG